MSLIMYNWRKIKDLKELAKLQNVVFVGNRECMKQWRLYKLNYLNITIISQRNNLNITIRNFNCKELFLSITGSGCLSGDFTNRFIST